MSNGKLIALILLSVAVLTLGIYLANSFREEIKPLLFWQYETLDVGCTGSMEPTLSCGDKVKVLRNPDRDEIKEGDIIVYRAPDDCVPALVSDRSLMLHYIVEGLYILHRVVWAGPDSVVTKGDAAPGWAEDPCYIPYDNIYGVVVDIQP